MKDLEFKAIIRLNDWVEAMGRRKRRRLYAAALLVIGLYAVVILL